MGIPGVLYHPEPQSSPRLGFRQTVLSSGVCYSWLVDWASWTNLGPGLSPLIFLMITGLLQPLSPFQPCSPGPAGCSGMSPCSAQCPCVGTGSWLLPPWGSPTLAAPWQGMKFKGSLCSLWKIKLCILSLPNVSFANSILSESESKGKAWNLACGRYH